MATYTTLKALFDAIADAIRYMDNTEPEIPAQTFPERIRAITTSKATPTPSEVVIKTPPKKTQYTGSGLRRDDFDPTGMTFTIKLEAAGLKISLPPVTDLSGLTADGKIPVNIADIVGDVITYLPEPYPYITFEPFKQLVPGTTKVDVACYYGKEVLRTAQPITVAPVLNTFGEVAALEKTWAELYNLQPNGATWAYIANYNTWPDGK